MLDWIPPKRGEGQAYQVRDDKTKHKLREYLSAVFMAGLSAFYQPLDGLPASGWFTSLWLAGRFNTKILNDKGWNVIHTGDAGLSRATENASSPSVVRIRQERLKGPEFSKLIINIFPKIQEVLVAGAMVTVTENSIRIRLIPLLKD